MTDAPPIITNEDAAIDSAFFGSLAGRTCYARAHLSGWVLVVRGFWKIGGAAQLSPLCAVTKPFHFVFTGDQAV
jgi:hypothetical protein